MKFCMTADADTASGVGRVTVELAGPVLNYFKNRDYGAAIHLVGLDLVCVGDNVVRKRLSRFVKDEKAYYGRIAFDFDEMVRLVDLEMKIAVVLREIQLELDRVVGKVEREKWIFDAMGLKRDFGEFVDQRSRNRQ